MRQTPLQQLREYGQSPWVHAPSADLVVGDLPRLMHRHGIRGAFADCLRGVQIACDLLRPVWEESEGQDGLASLGAHAGWDAAVLWRLVDRPNLLVSIPATPEGLAAIEDSIAAGISVDANPIFSLARYEEVIEAYQRGVERLIAADQDPSSVASLATFHISAIDLEVDGRLSAIGGSALQLRGRLGIATARLAYQRYRETVGASRWHALESRGARRQRCRWASTSTMGTPYCDVLYVEELIGPETVTTLVPRMIDAFELGGLVADKLERGTDEARSAFDDVLAVGVDLDDACQTLERAGATTADLTGVSAGRRPWRRAWPDPREGGAV